MCYQMKKAFLGLSLHNMPHYDPAYWLNKAFKCFSLLKKQHALISCGLYAFRLNPDIEQLLRDIQDGKKSEAEVNDFIISLQQSCKKWESLNASKHV